MSSVLEECGLSQRMHSYYWIYSILGGLGERAAWVEHDVHSLAVNSANCSLVLFLHDLSHKDFGPWS